MSTFGRTSYAGCTWDGAGDADGKVIGRYTLTESGNVSKLTIYVDNSSGGACYIRGIIYSNNGSNQPYSLLGTGDSMSVAGAQGPGWVDLTFPTPVALTAADYWIGLQLDSNASGVDLAAISVANYGAYLADTYSDGPSNPWGSTALEALNLCVYATYSAGSAPVVTSLSVTSGPVAGGTSTVITGSGFTAATAVHFGNANAPTYTVNNDTTITVTSPPGIG